MTSTFSVLFYFFLITVLSTSLQVVPSFKRCFWLLKASDNLGAPPFLTNWLLGRGVPCGPSVEKRTDNSHGHTGEAPCCEWCCLNSKALKKITVHKGVTKSCLHQTRYCCLRFTEDCHRWNMFTYKVWTSVRQEESFLGFFSPFWRGE